MPLTNAAGALRRMAPCAKCFSPGVVVDPYDGCTVACSNRRCDRVHSLVELAEWNERYTSIFNRGRRVLQ